jgi:hypothetical protein
MIFIAAVTNLQLPDQGATQNDFDNTSVTSQADDPRSDVSATHDQQSPRVVNEIENATSSSEDGDISLDTKESEIRILETPLLSLPTIDNSNDLKHAQSTPSNTLQTFNQGSKTNEIKCLPIDKETANNGQNNHNQHKSNICNSPYWIVFLASLFYFFSQGVDGFFQSQTYSFALCGPLKLEPKFASYINSAFFGSYCLGRIISIPISQKVHPSIIIISALTLCCLSSAFLSLFGGSSLEALLVGNAIMGLSISFQFPSGLTWLASEMPGGMKSIYTSFMFTGSNCGWIVLPPLASTLFYVISPSAPFVTAFICNIFHMIIFIAMHKLSRYFRTKSNM